MIARTLVVRTMREVLDDRDFLELETPILTRSTPEGARDFLVPSRMNAGSFYALPQSPQLFKQLFMMAGFERYYQIARCFRDEDLRADRQPEFTQLDLEMAFVAEDDVIAVMEAVMEAVFAATDFAVPPTPWPRMGYDEAVSRFGVDRPDTRFGLEIHDVGPLLAGSDFKVFESVLGGGGVVRALNAGRARALALRARGPQRRRARPRREGRRADLRRIRSRHAGWAGNLAKFFTAEQIAAVNAELGAADGDLLLFVADSAKVAAASLGGLRLHLAERFGLIPEGRHDPVWITDFPMFESDEEGGTHVALGGAPPPVHGARGRPGRSRARCARGRTTSCSTASRSAADRSASTRRRSRRRSSTHLGLPPDEARERFGFLLEALRYGAPPHGGIAMGVDRIVALICGLDSIRDVIAFPKTASGSDPLTGAPAPVDAPQLKELALRSLVEPPAPA